MVCRLCNINKLYVYQMMHELIKYPHGKWKIPRIVAVFVAERDICAYDSTKYMKPTVVRVNRTELNEGLKQDKIKK